MATNNCIIGPGYPYPNPASVEKVNNGYVVRTSNGTYVAHTLKEAARLLIENFEVDRG